MGFAARGRDRFAREQPRLPGIAENGQTGAASAGLRK
jgi:hypothetical protein